MNVVVGSADLVREVTILSRVVSDKPTLPILSNVLMQASDGWVHLSATDLEVALVTACPAKVTTAGDMTLPVDKLAALAKTLPNVEIELSKDMRGTVKFTAGGFNSRLQSLPAEDFPTIAHPEGQSVSLPRGAFAELIKKVKFAISEKDGRHGIKGALLTLPEDAFGLVATDANRLALAPATRKGPAMEPILLPLKCLEPLAFLLQDAGEGDLTLTQTDRHIFFDLDGRLLLSRRLDAKFPNYERVIPKDNQLRAQVDRVALMHIVQRQLHISSIVQVALQDGIVEISSSSVEVGEGIEQIPATYTGPRQQMKLMGEYVVDFLQAASSPSITLAMKDTVTPLLLEDGNYINVVMGMR